MTAAPDRAVVFSILLHLAVAAATAINIDWERPRPASVPALAIQATVIDTAQIDRQRREIEAALEEERRERDARRVAEEKRVAEEAKVQREAEQAVQRKREQEEALRLAEKAEETARRARAEELRIAEATREATEKAERVRKAELERQRQEQAERERKEAEEARQAAIRKKKAVEDERRAREAQMRAQAVREEQLLAMLAVENQRSTAVDSGLLDEYVALITQEIRRNWIRPPSVSNDMECWVSVQQIPGGEVVAVDMLDCDVAPAVWRSIEAAIKKSSPLPGPRDPTLFERNLEILFVPNE